ncbi:MAG TPA: PAS domain S-box protein [Candidatus Obscuribacter sp.]|nr:PAS domain S-box protein [Candidatus Obscuribacter sp.]
MVCVTMAAGFILNHNNLVIQEKSWVAETQAIINKLDNIAALNLKAESSARAFYLSREQKYLNERNHAVKELKERLQELASMLNDQPQQEKDASLLQKIISQRLALTDHATWEAAHATTDHTTVDISKGAALTEKLEDLVAEMKDCQNDRISQRETEFLRNVIQTNRIEGLLGVLCILALSFSLFLTYRYMSAKKESDVRFRAIFNQTFQLIGLLTPDGRLLEANQTALDMVGVDPATLRNKFFWDTPWWQHSPQEQELLKQAIKDAASGKFVRFQTNHIGRGGETITIDFSIKPVLDDSGKVLYLLPEGRDMTEQKRAQESTTASEQHLKALLTCLAEGVYQIDLEGNLVYMNGAAERILQYQENELLGKNMHNIIHSSSDAVPSQAPFPQLSTGQREQPGGDFKLLSVVERGEELRISEDWFRRKDGTSVPVEYVGSPLLQNGEVKGAVIAFQDITTRKEAEKRVSEFYSTVSHELRTPLTSIRGAMRLLEAGKGGELTERGKHLTTMGRIECDRLVRLINDMLDIRKMEAGKLDLRYAEFDAVDAARQAISNLQAYADEHRVSITLKPAPVIMLNADRDRFTQILTNLVSNAVRFSPLDSEVKVSLDNLTGEQTLKVSIQDSGPGIKQTDQRKLFKVFQQLDATDARRKGGTGLGLAICKSLVEQHGGRIGLNSAEGEGATFWFTLPIYGKQQPEKKQPDEKKQPEKKQQDTAISSPAEHKHHSSRYRKSKGKHERVKALIAENDKFTRNLLELQLRRMGIEVICTESGEGALKILNRDPIELIILELGLPDISGTDLIAKLKEEGKGEIPLVVYTAQDLTHEERLCTTLGETRHLTKSLSGEEDFVAAVKEVLGERARDLPDMAVATDNRLPSMTEAEALRLRSKDQNSQ